MAEVATTVRASAPKPAGVAQPTLPAAVLASAVPAPAPSAQPAQELPPGHVLCRVTKYGDDKIATGESIPSPSEDQEHFPRHKAGDMVILPQKVALAQEKNGNLEIQD